MHLLGSAFFLLLTILAATNAAVLDRTTMVVHESIKAVPTGFTHSGSISPDQEITLRIALTHADITGLQAKTYAVSDPGNKLYGQHLTVDEVFAFTRPTALTASAVSTWLSSNSIIPTSISPAGDVLSVTLSASNANALLDAQFEKFAHVASGTTMVRTLAYSVPASLQEHVRYVHPTVAFIPPLQAPAMKAAGGVNASCAAEMNPSCLQELYAFPTDLANNSAQNVLGVAGYVNEFANFADLALFTTQFFPTRPASDSNFTVIEVDEGTNSQTLSNAGVEADLDMDMASLAGGVPLTFFTVGGEDLDGIDGFIDITNTILVMPVETRPTVLTTSYGFNEQDIPDFLNTEMCNAYTQLGAVGISVLFASGDGGVGGFQSIFCEVFVPTSPSDCPFITSVGGVTGLPPQTAASFSSGGFSETFEVPDYQAADVAAYVASIGNEYDGLYSTNSRGIPDLAMQAENVEFAWEGGLFIVSGTSAATPMFAAMIALINDRLIAAGKPVLGFLNPFLYSAQGRAAFTDITSGTNPGCGTNGFSAGPGWDPVTGLGTPNFEQLLAAVGL
ncbi:Family S53 protease [Mycena sanguinolenta]|uniref:tripeptidyl-peptidase II n=1 Tax=Mycena sanguinolenta TaxID=230812 RepID=A0A8H7DP77_9AGAR|nr:Family S53 protease [Mycena sanguinolenta]